MSLKTWLLNKLVNYALKEGRKKKVQKMWEDFLDPDSNSTMPGMHFEFKVNEKGECNCPYHCKVEEKKEVKRTIEKKTRKGTR